MKAFVMKVDTAQRLSHSGVGEHQRAEGTDELSQDQTSETAEHVVVNYLPVDRGHLPRTINHEGRNAEQ